VFHPRRSTRQTAAAIGLQIPLMQGMRKAKSLRTLTRWVVELSVDKDQAGIELLTNTAGAVSVSRGRTIVE